MKLAPMKLSKKQLINLASFQLLWFICVQGNNVLALSALIIFFGIHVLFVAKENAEYLFVAIFSLLGFVVESAVNTLGLIHYADGFSLSLFNHTILTSPLWLLCLWAGFGTTFFHSLAWLGAKPLLGSALVIISIPFSYYFGAELSDSVFPGSAMVALTIITLIWLAILPFGFFLVEQLRRLLNEGKPYALLK